MSERSKSRAELVSEIDSLKAELYWLRQDHGNARHMPPVRKKFFSLVDQAPHYVMVIDPLHKGGPAVTSANPAACAMHGLSEQQFREKPFAALFAEPYRPSVLEWLDRTVAKQRSTCECEALREDGSAFPVSLSGELVMEDMKPVVYAIERTLAFQKNTEEALKYSERQLATLMDNIPGIAYRCRNDRYWTMDFISNGCRELTGYQAEDLIDNRKKAYADLIHPDDRKDIYTIVEKALKGKKPFEIEYRIITASGEIKHVWEKGVCVEETSCVFLEGIIIDITERRNAENEKKASEERYSLLFENMFLGIGITSPDGKIHVVNKAMCDILGYTHEEILRMNASTFYAEPTERERLISLLRKNRYLENFETRLKRKDGRHIWVHYKVYPFFYEGAEAFFITCIDITERKQSELQLRKLSVALEQSPVSIIMTDREGNIEYVNPAFVTTTGYDTGEVTGKNLRMFKTGERPNSYYRNIWKTISEGVVWQDEFHSKKKNGELFWEKSTIGPITESDGKTSHFIALSEDITEKKIIEQALQMSEEKYRKLVEGSIQGVLIAQDNPLRVSYASHPMETITGYAPEELTRLSPEQIHSMVHPEDRDIFFSQFRKRLSGEKKQPRRDYRIMHRNGGYVWVAVHSTSIEYEGHPATQTVFLDITNYKKAESQKEKLEEQLRQAQKLETIGTLAGGIAHDFNNILTPILGYAEMAQLRLGTPDAISPYLDAIVKAALRAKKLVAQILTFNCQAAQQQKPVNLALVVADVLELLAPSIPREVSLRKYLPTPCARIIADPSQIHQVIMNLCTNALQAMQKKGGTLTIGLKKVRCTAGMAKNWPNLKPECEYNRLTVCDTGIGIDKKNLERIFEPFFSTKPPDKGTGLGLSVVHGIIQSHNGTITVQSKPGKGTAVHVYFPVCAMDAGEHALQQPPFHVEDESILVIDNDASVTDTIRHMLVQLGYHTVTSNSSLLGTALFCRQPSRFELVFTDLSMPELNGFEVADKISRKKPCVPIIIITGNNNQIGENELKRHHIRAILVKPVTFSELAAIIRKTLYQKSSNEPS